jgi:hypothetical protein
MPHDRFGVPRILPGRQLGIGRPADVGDGQDDERRSGFGH